MKLRRKHMTLLEVLISLGLVLLVLTTLSYFYRQVTNMDRIMDNLQEESFRLLYLENRLSQIIPQATDATKLSYDHIFVLTPDNSGLYLNHNPSLLFTYDHCVHLNKEFANQVLGRLYLDPEGRFSLAMWPAPKRWIPDGSLPHMKKEILMENVESVEFEFYGAPQKKMPKTTRQISKPAMLPTEYWAEWRPEWHWDFEQQPALVKLIIKRVGIDEKLVYIFPLPNTYYPIIYEK